MSYNHPYPIQTPSTARQGYLQMPPTAATLTHSISMLGADGSGRSSPEAPSALSSLFASINTTSSLSSILEDHSSVQFTTADPPKFCPSRWCPSAKYSPADWEWPRPSSIFIL
ncbi:hypothetical protein FRC10_003480 [Ceratobasidium sp. 414]|nr:hypothetical protein FRC10_003480 [Ceratobasidium sp. 414]